MKKTGLVAVLVMLAAFGVASPFAAGILETYFPSVPAGVIEELISIIGPIGVAAEAPWFFSKRLNVLIAALVMGGAFSAVEGSLYITVLGASPWVRAMVAPLHIYWTGLALFGLALAVSKSNGEERSLLLNYLKPAPITLLLLPMLLHTSFDGLILEYNMVLNVIGFIFLNSFSELVFLRALFYFPKEMGGYNFPGIMSMMRDIFLKWDLKN